MNGVSWQRFTDIGYRSASLGLFATAELLVHNHVASFQLFYFRSTWLQNVQQKLKKNMFSVSDKTKLVSLMQCLDKLFLLWCFELPFYFSSTCYFCSIICLLLLPFSNFYSVFILFSSTSHSCEQIGILF